jgi:hypothetical protein
MDAAGEMSAEIFRTHRPLGFRGGAAFGRARGGQKGAEPDQLERLTLTAAPSQTYPCRQVGRLLPQSR